MKTHHTIQPCVCTARRRLQALSMQGLWLVIAAIALLAAMMSPLSASAATPKLCVPVANGVPYWNGAPNWWSTDADPGKEILSKAFSKDFRRTEDPRWRGALDIGYGAGATDQSEFRALFDNTANNEALLLSWSIKKLALDLNAMNQPTGATSVIVGLQFGGDPRAVRLRVSQQSTKDSTGVVRPKSPTDGGTVYLDTSFFVKNGATWTTDTNPPAGWTSNTRVWITPEAMSSPSQTSFTIQMRVPLTSLANFRMWYSMQPSVPFGSVSGLSAFTWPRGPIADMAYYDDATGGKHIPDPATKWGELALGQQQGCAGVTLGDDDIGAINTQFPNSRSQISITSPNTFYALPRNESPSNIDMSGITATFYFANWGTQRGDLDPTGNSWQILTTSLKDKPTLTLSTDSTIEPPLPTPGPGQPTPPPPYPDPPVSRAPATVKPQQKAQIAPGWPQMTQFEACKFFVEASPSQYLAEAPSTAFPSGRPGFCSGLPAPTLNPHNCMLVVLNGPTEFIRGSALRNMDFAKASTFSRPAEVRTGPGARDVYLFVDRRNMPKATRPDGDARREVAPQSVNEKLKQVHATLSRGEIPVLSYEELAAVMPTYVVHAYADTGKTVMIDGRQHVLLDQQSSFGYFVQHDGPVD